MSQDTLSDVLRGVRLRGAVFFYISGSSEWAAEAPPAKEIAPLLMPRRRARDGVPRGRAGQLLGRHSRRTVRATVRRRRGDVSARRRARRVERARDARQSPT